MTDTPIAPDLDAPVADYLDRAAWLKERQHSVGGSDAAAVVGADPYKTALQVYHEKTGVVEDAPPTPDQLRGRLYEPIAFLLLVQETGCKIRRAPMRRHRDHDFMAVSMDRQIVSDPRGPGYAEAKCPSPHVFHRQIRAKGMSDSHQLQLQHGLEVTGHSWGRFVVFECVRPRIIYFDVERDPEVGAFLVEQETRFWKHVQDREPPEEKAITLPDLPEAKGEIVLRNDPEWAEAVADLRDARDLVATAEQLEEYAKSRLKGLMGGYGVHEGAGFRAYHRSMPGRTTFDKRALAQYGALDPNMVALLVGEEVADAGARKRLLERMTDMARLDLTQFEKRGAAFNEFRGFLLTAGTEE